MDVDALQHAQRNLACRRRRVRRPCDKTPPASVRPRETIATSSPKRRKKCAAFGMSNVEETIARLGHVANDTDVIDASMRCEAWRASVAIMPVSSEGHTQQRGSVR